MEERTQAHGETDDGVIVDALEGDPGPHDLGVEVPHAILEVLLVERPVLGHQEAHAARAAVRCASTDLAARPMPPVVGEHVRDAAALPAAGGGGEPEVPVLRALDEARVVAAHLRPYLAPVERGHVDGAPREQLLDREATRAPDAVVTADEAYPRVHDPHVRLRLEDGDRLRQEGGSEVVVGVERDDVRSAGMLHGEAAGRGRAAVLGPDDGYPGLGPRPLEGRERPGLRGAVVDDDDLVVLVALRGDAGERLGEVRAGVVNRHDDRDPRAATVLRHRSNTPAAASGGRAEDARSAPSWKRPRPSPTR